VRKIIEIKDSEAFNKLKGCRPASYSESPFEAGSEQFKQLIQDDFKKIKSCSRLIVQNPTHYHHHKDGYIDVECKIKGGDVIVYRFFPSGRKESLQHKVIKVSLIEQLFDETIVFVDKDANESEMEHSAMLAAKSAVRYKWELK